MRQMRIQAAHTMGCALAGVLLGLLAGAAPARAQSITEYGASRLVSYTQTSDATPAAPELWTLIAYVVADQANAIHSAVLSFSVPPPVSYPMPVVNPFVRQYAAPDYTTEAAFLAHYPATTYTITVDLGAGSVSGGLALPRDLYCPQIPTFTSSTFSRLQTYDASLAFNGTINGFTMAPGTNGGFTFVTVVQVGQPEPRWWVELSSTATSFQIPAGLLLPGTDYIIGVSYYDEVSLTHGGFDTATSKAGYYRSTSASFTTLPGVSSATDPLPVVMVVDQNRPNPFNPRTTIHFALPRDQNVTLRIFDLHGVVVRTLIDGPLAAGPHDATWEGRDDHGHRAPSGTYLYHLRSEDGEVTRTMLMLR
jgi:hypothetical protein